MTAMRPEGEKFQKCFDYILPAKNAMDFSVYEAKFIGKEVVMNGNGSSDGTWSYRSLSAIQISL
jgi:hypothetical protein